MKNILTLVASTDRLPVKTQHFSEIKQIIEHYNLRFNSDINWLDKNKAADIAIEGEVNGPLIDHLRDNLTIDKIDFFITSPHKRQKKLLLADMDSTITSSETLDELAEFAGIKEKVSKITSLAMEGKLDFHEALRERVGLLKGLSISAVTETLKNTKLNPGATTFAPTMQTFGATCVLVSGGFTLFTSEISKQSGFEFHHGNILEIEDGTLTGKVKEPILDKHSKVEFLMKYINDLGIDIQDCMTIGDGANDIPMLKKAGLGIGYHPKMAVLKEIRNSIIYGDLTACLYAQGYSKKHFHTLDTLNPD